MAATRKVLMPVLTPLIGLSLGAGLFLAWWVFRPRALPPGPGTPAPPVINRDEALKNLKAQADEIGRAAVEEDHEHMAALTYPAVVEGIGGKERFVARLKEMAADMHRQGFRFTRASLGEPAGPAESAGDLYAVVPYTLEVAAPDGRVGKKPSYYVAVSRDGGVRWSFLDGEGFGGDHAKLRRVLPEFPDALELPAARPTSIVGGAARQDEWVEFRSKSAGFKGLVPHAAQGGDQRERAAYLRGGGGPRGALLDSDVQTRRRHHHALGG